MIAAATSHPGTAEGQAMVWWSMGEHGGARGSMGEHGGAWARALVWVEQSGQTSKWYHIQRWFIAIRLAFISIHAFILLGWHSLEAHRRFLIIPQDYILVVRLGACRHDMGEHGGAWCSVG